MRKHPSESDPIDSKAEPFRIDRSVMDLNRIKWTVENLKGVLTPGQKELREIPEEKEWKTASFEEILISEMTELTLRVTWLYKDGFLSNLQIMPLAPKKYKAPSGSHIEVRLTPLMATIPDSKGQPGAQLTISVEVALGTVHASREFRVNGHGDWHAVE